MWPDTSVLIAEVSGTSYFDKGFTALAIPP
jgi:hypothetical protein